MIFFLIYSSAFSPQSIPFAIRRVEKRSAFIEVDEREDNTCSANMLKLATQHVGKAEDTIPLQIAVTKPRDATSLLLVLYG